MNATYHNQLLDHSANYWVNFLLNGGLLIREWKSSEFTNAGGG